MHKVCYFPFKVMSSQTKIKFYFQLWQLPIKWDTLVLAPSWPEEFKAQTSHPLPGSSGLEMGWEVEAPGKEEGWPACWSCDTTDRNARFTWPRRGHRREHQFTAQGVSGLLDAGLFLFLIPWLFHMECRNAVMPQSTASWTCALNTGLLRRWVVLGLSKTVITPAICERPNPPVCLLSFQGMPTGLGLPPVVSQEEVGISALRTATDSVSTDWAGRHTGSFRRFQV